LVARRGKRVEDPDRVRLARTRAGLVGNTVDLNTQAAFVLYELKAISDCVKCRSERRKMEIRKWKPAELSRHGRCSENAL
jgi:hypothetical protein